MQALEREKREKEERLLKEKADAEMRETQFALQLKALEEKNAQDIERERVALQRKMDEIAAEKERETNSLKSDMDAQVC